MIFKILKMTLMFCIFILFCWFVISWIDILNNNLGNGSHFQNWNLIRFALEKYL